MIYIKSLVDKDDTIHYRIKSRKGKVLNRWMQHQEDVLFLVRRHHIKWLTLIIVQVKSSVRLTWSQFSFFKPYITWFIQQNFSFPNDPCIGKISLKNVQLWITLIAFLTWTIRLFFIVIRGFIFPQNATLLILSVRKLFISNTYDNNLTVWDSLSKFY